MPENAIFDDGAALLVGASGGIGSAIAQVLAADGCNLALTYRNNPDRIDLNEETSDVAISRHRLDVTDQVSIGEAVDAARERHGRIHSLIWAAGPLVEQRLIAEIDSAEWDRAFAVETRGFLDMVKAMLPHMREGGGGAIVHLGSAGHMRWPDRDALSVVPKAANESLVQGIAREEGRHGIRANSILVGVIDAGMFHELMEKGAFPESWVEETMKALAIKRWGKAEEIGYAVSWLVSSRTTYVTGQQINVSGGFGI